MSSQLRRPRAFATTTAIMYFAIVSVVIGFVTFVIAADAARTASVVRDAQLRQLQFAGLVAATEIASSAKADEPLPVALPAELLPASVQIQFKPADADAKFREAEITTRVPWNESRPQVIRVELVQTAGRWSADAVQLVEQQ